MFRKWRSSRIAPKSRTAPRRPLWVFRARLQLEWLEDRTLWAFGLTGVPTWIEQGPGPTLNGQVENIPGTNPVDGAVQTVVADPGNADTLYAGTVNGGVWKTTNATANQNATWKPLTDLFPSLSIGALALDPTDGTHQTLVAGIGRFSSFGGSGGPLTGLLRTLDGGDTWTPLGATDLAGRNIDAVAPRGQTILVGADAGMYRSTDDGGTFQLISGMNNLNNGPVLDLEGVPGQPAVFYAAVGGGSAGLFETANMGNTWTNITAGTAGLIGAATANIKLAVYNATTVYAGIVNGGQLAGVFRTANSGTTWTSMDIPGTVAGTQGITAASNATPIVITTATPHGLATGNQVRIEGVAGNIAANGNWTITQINATQFSLNGSAGNGLYAGGGQWGRINVPITGASNTTPIVITSAGHGLANGAQVFVTGVQGNTAANGYWTVTGVTANTVTLVGSAGNAAYTMGGTWSPIIGIQPGGQGETNFSIAADPTDANGVDVGGDRQPTIVGNALGARDYSGCPPSSSSPGPGA